MGRIIRWKRMRYGTSERNIERSLAVLFVPLLASMGKTQVIRYNGKVPISYFQPISGLSIGRTR